MTINYPTVKRTIKRKEVLYFVIYETRKVFFQKSFHFKNNYMTDKYRLSRGELAEKNKFAIAVNSPAEVCAGEIWSIIFNFWIKGNL